jgi:hypothetical protein
LVDQNTVKRLVWGLSSVNNLKGPEKPYAEQNKVIVNGKTQKWQVTMWLIPFPSCAGLIVRVFITDLSAGTDESPNQTHYV